MHESDGRVGLLGDNVVTKAFSSFPAHAVCDEILVLAGNKTYVSKMIAAAKKFIAGFCLVGEELRRKKARKTRNTNAKLQKPHIVVNKWIRDGRKLPAHRGERKRRKCCSTAASPSKHSTRHSSATGRKCWMHESSPGL